MDMTLIDTPLVLNAKRASQCGLPEAQWDLLDAVAWQMAKDGGYDDVAECYQQAAEVLKDGVR